MSAVTPRLELRQGQSLVMTQQLQQSIKLLQMSSQELAEYLEQELEKNPLLTVEEDDKESASSEEGQAEEGSETAASEASETPAEVDTATSEQQESWEEDGGYEPDLSSEPRTHSRMNDEYDEGTEAFAVSEVSLREHLLKQFSVIVQDPVMLLVGQHLIDLVDDAGYIKDDLSSLKEQLGCDDALIEATFAKLHTLDPSGVCARSLPECLSIQLADKDHLDPAMKCLLEHLDWVAAGKFAELVKCCGVDMEDVKDMCAELRTLNPRPGLAFQNDDVQAVVPDVLLKSLRNGRWQVELNPAVLPRVLINRPYYALVNAKSRDRAEKKYITDQLAVANWLIKALDQRANTLLKVATEIVAQQDMFLHHGIRYLKPLTLKEVAATTGLHESTVSRITTSKFMMTPRGTFELKYFFNASLAQSGGGEGISNKSVQFMIKEIVDEEAPSAPLSDDAIAAELKARGIEIARRTIAKYRDILKIPSSSQRRKKL